MAALEEEQAFEPNLAWQIATGSRPLQANPSCSTPGLDASRQAIAGMRIGLREAGRTVKHSR